MINNAMSSGGSSMIRKITRGVSSGNGDVTISCSITDTNKVIVLLNPDVEYGSDRDATASGEYYYALAGGAVYLKSISTTGITVVARGVSDVRSVGKSSPGYTSITFSYQIIEFM